MISNTPIAFLSKTLHSDGLLGNRTLLDVMHLSADVLTYNMRAAPTGTGRWSVTLRLGQPRLPCGLPTPRLVFRDGHADGHARGSRAARAQREHSTAQGGQGGFGEGGVGGALSFRKRRVILHAFD